MDHWHKEKRPLTMRIDKKWNDMYMADCTWIIDLGSNAPLKTVGSSHCAFLDAEKTSTLHRILYLPYFHSRTSNGEGSSALSRLCTVSVGVISISLYSTLPVLSLLLVRRRRNKRYVWCQWVGGWMSVDFIRSRLQPDDSKPKLYYVNERCYD
jgi:hypothetical protein